MRDVPKIVEIAIATVSTDPLRGIVEIGTGVSTTKYELDEDMAHSICTVLEHFLTQRQRRNSLHDSMQPVIQVERDQLSCSSTL
jgi:hypothetical protein